LPAIPVQIDGVLGGAEFGHVLLELGLNVLGGGRISGKAIAFRGIRGENTDAATIGEDEQVIPFHGWLLREGLGAVEEVVQISGLDTPAWRKAAP